MAGHAILSASSAHRWLHCPPSARYEQQFPTETSPYAEEGTRAHQLAQTLIEMQVGLTGDASLDTAIDQIEPDREMFDAAEMFRNLVAPIQGQQDTYVEQRIDLTPWVPEGFGTSDAVVVHGDALNVYDLKYGKGVPVSAEGNPQTRLYALGALHTLGFLYEIETVRTTIVQPRLDSVSSEEMSVAEILAWGETVKPVARTAFAGNGTFQPGAWCRFCRARDACRARAEANLDLAKWEFRRPADLTPEEIAEILRQGADLEHWLGSLREHALQQALTGAVYPGWKLVEGRSIRRYTDEGALLQALQGRADLDDLAPRTPIGVPAMEKALGKGVFTQLVQPHVVKPPGKPTLVPESDKRPPVSTAALDFKEASE